MNLTNPKKSILENTRRNLPKGTFSLTNEVALGMILRYDPGALEFTRMAGDFFNTRLLY